MNFREYIKKNITISDGGMGTMLFSLRPDLSSVLSEKFNLLAPEIVTSIHKAYYEAGSNIVSTNTFGANILKYSYDELSEIIAAAVNNVKLARDSANANQEKFVALDIGPTGRLLEPFGNLSFEDAVNVFKTTCEIGSKLGIDLIVIETFTDLYETKAAVIGAKEACDLPIIVTNAYSENGKLLTGASPRTVIETLTGLGVDAIGINCSFGPKESLSIIDEYIKYSKLPISFKPNAGLPDSEGKYTLSPKDFAETIEPTIKEGVSIVGGCCGTTPDFIKAVSGFANLFKTERTIGKATVVTSGTKAVEFGKDTVVIGERLNPTGKKVMKEALKNNDMDYILREGEHEIEEGADILDVNVGMPGIDEPEMMVRAVKTLQQSVSVPLQIDTTDSEALSRALRIYNGKPLINSVNGKKESMDVVFPLAKKYGGVIVCLLLDEDGIPETTEGRIEIAKKIIKEAEKYGISTENLIFDALCLTISTDKNAGIVTLNSVKALTDMGLKTVLGVSNISYGLPERPVVNSTFYSLAKENGLSSAIINPYMPNVFDEHAKQALLGEDENCTAYIEYISSKTQDVAPISNTADDKKETLFDAIRKGHKQSAETITNELILTKSTLEIINEEIIPSLNKVGEDYEKNVIFLPQLLMSAETAGVAFGVIKKATESSKTKTEAKAKFVIATVKGDIHDIGKNIVKMLLQNYGYDVIDLGKDVAPIKVLEACKETGARLVGLSALMTTTLPSMKETVDILRREVPDAKICVGGAVLTQEYADTIGADKYAKDAMDTVAWAESVI